MKQEPKQGSKQGPDRLACLVADHAVLYQKLRGYHWNVKDPWFFTLHERFEQLHRDAAGKVDALAERLVALGRRPPSTLAEQLALATLREDGGAGGDALEMVRDVSSDLQRLIDDLRDEAGRRGAAGDDATAELLGDLARSHEGELWMLRAFLAA